VGRPEVYLVPLARRSLRPRAQLYRLTEPSKTVQCEVSAKRQILFEDGGVMFLRRGGVKWSPNLGSVD
jgi:hypothetical protein